ncbi:MAG: hypothetical protein IPF53_13335 [Blastocatellia bacterium]|nr:hypothetical protein [Blastocatellia bacterium]MBK6425809.1 hypothetical protein [Blastocatellia bacterium]
MFPRLTVGVEYNPAASDVGPLVNFVAVTETDRRPALILGTSSDRIGTPEGRSFYATLSKDLTEATGLPIAPYVGVSYGQFDDRARPIGGININFTDRISASALFDGVKVHPLVSYSFGRHQIGLVFAQGRNPGVTYNFTF